MAPLRRGRSSSSVAPIQSQRNATNSTTDKKITAEQRTLRSRDVKTRIPSITVVVSPRASRPERLSATMPASTQHASSARRPSATPSIGSASTTKPSTAERNIDNVVLGDIMFRAWYPSMFRHEIVGKDVIEERRGKVDMLDRLFVCEGCFKYEKEGEKAWQHREVCGRLNAEAEEDEDGCLAQVPGKRIYTHGSDAVWSVWEVDGEVDSLYCQCLSLFGKLFLDNKSVFYDVRGFLYFLLVHTDLATNKQQVVGFFSKEKMSWDNNNLACILIFPPWQSKGLGSLLIAVSYEIARRENIVGGPEKPLSDLGKKGYIRFWSGEIARYLLGVRETDKKKGKGMVSVEQISTATWIAVDDCLVALREIGVCEAAGRGKGELPRVRVDKDILREWAKKNRVGLEPVIDGEGFTDGYGYRILSDEEMED